MTKLSLSALAAAGLLASSFATSANAADFGGNCCADLEERIAELEATTARKGNRKVSLTISGWVAQQLTWWDDGYESNTYIQDTGSVSIGTHFKFAGQATIVPGVTAGYVLNIEAIANDSLLTTQNTDESVLGAQNALSLVSNGTPGALGVESSYWFVKSEKYGRVSLGQQSSAADNQAILPDGSGSLVPANYVLYDINGMFLRRSNSPGGANASFVGLVWGNIGDCAPQNGSGGVQGDCDGYVQTQIKYDSPTFAGFSVSASWGEDDVWSVSGRYAGEHHGFKLAAAVAYNESTDENGAGGLNNAQNAFNAQRNGGFHAAAFQVGAYVQHVATGLFLYGAYTTETDVNVAARANEPEGDQWYLKAGLRTRLNPLGATVFYGEYGENEDRFTSQAYDAGVNSSEFRQYGLGVVQEVDAAAMSFWLAWRHYEADISCDNANAVSAAATCTTLNLDNGGSTGLEDLDIVKFGALINF